MTWLAQHWHYALAAFLCGVGGGLIGGALAVGLRFGYWRGYKDGAERANQYIHVIERREQ